ncbi:MAG: DUF3365 domain-containing protein [Campylobacterota bacterium]|nr:DUF3365 domain-containing protein [Campylobacterota bacterium]
MLLFIAIVVLVMVLFFAIDNAVKVHKERDKSSLLEAAKSNYYIINRNFNWYAQYQKPYNKKGVDNLQEKSDTLFRHQEFQEKNKFNSFKYQVLSLNPINPKNSPDYFEREALEYLSQKTDKNYYYKIDDKLENFKFLGVLKMKKSCLSCHAKEEYSLDALSGGIRINIPTEFYTQKLENMYKNALYLKVAIVLFAIFIYHLLFALISKKYRQKHSKKLQNIIIV